jgi:hypothetical protein
LKEIGDEAFSEWGIKSIRIPNNVENIGISCFSGCQFLCEVIFESDSKLKEIGSDAFGSSWVDVIGIPDNVTERL